MTKDRLMGIRGWILHSPWLERIARFGYAAKGVVYLIVGVLAVPAVFGAANATLGIHGALHAILGGLFGALVLIVVGIGLGAYVFWRLIEAILDPEHNGTNAKGLIQRAVYAVSAAVFANLAFEAIELVIEWGSSANITTNITAEDWTRFLLAQPLGRWLVASTGGISIGFGLYQFYTAYTAAFRDKFNVSELSRRQEVWLVYVGRFGYAARGIVFTIIGSFLILAALQSNAKQAGGLSDALLSLEQTSFGLGVLGVVALGLIAYGMYLVAEARYRRIVNRDAQHL
jgi:hypothetical protein